MERVQSVRLSLRDRTVPAASLASGEERWGLPATLAVAGAGLFGFIVLSCYLPWARSGFGVLGPIAPPVYGLLDPRFSPFGYLALALATLGGLGAFWVVRRETVRARWFLPAAALCMLAFAASVVMVDGPPSRFVGPIERARPPDYQVDVRLVRDRGVRSFVREYPTLVREAESIHTVTHPPGPMVALAALEGLFPNHYVPRALAIALAGVLVLIPAWFIARRVGGRRAATYAVLLSAVAPGSILHVFTSMDAVYATALAGSAALLLYGLGPEERPRLAFIGGLALGLTTFLTYAASFIAMFGVLYTFRSKPTREAARALAVAVAGGVTGLLVLWAAFGYDVFASYRGNFEALARFSGARNHLYWLFGSVAAWLIFAGLPVAALGIREVAARRPWYVLALLVPLVVFYALPADVTRIIPGETERTLQFAYPFAAAAAGVWLARREREREERSRTMPRTMGLLVALSAAQAIALEAVYHTFW